MVTDELRAKYLAAVAKQEQTWEMLRGARKELEEIEMVQCLTWRADWPARKHLIAACVSAVLMELDRQEAATELEGC